jgi:hypothetical protein
MSMHPLLDVSPADWIVDADGDWWTKALYGPPGFPAYARVLFDLDSNNDSYDEDVIVMQWVLDHLRNHTTPPDDGFVGIWHGWGFWERSFHPAAPRAPRFAIPNREYVLLGGPLGEALTAESLGTDDPTTPHFIWPSDQAWCIASDVDPDWFGVGGSTGVIQEILADERLDSVPSAYGEYLEDEQ